MSRKSRLGAAFTFVLLFVVAGLSVSYMSGGGVLGYKGSGVNEDDRAVTVTVYAIRDAGESSAVPQALWNGAGIVEANEASGLRTKLAEIAASNASAEFYRAVGVIQNRDSGSMVLESERDGTRRSIRIGGIEPRILGDDDELGPIRLTIGELTIDGRSVVVSASEGEAAGGSRARDGFSGPVVLPDGGGALMLIQSDTPGGSNWMALALFADATRVD